MDSGTSPSVGHFQIPKSESSLSGNTASAGAKNTISDTKINEQSRNTLSIQGDGLQN